MTEIPLTTEEECRNEIRKIADDARLLLLEAMAAENNGHSVPDGIKDGQQALAERLYNARSALAALRGQPEITRPEYLDPLVVDQP